MWPPKNSAPASGANRVLETYMQRVAAGELRWVMTDYPCPAMAQDASMSLAAYEDFIFAATYADQDDAVGCWEEEA